MTRTIHCIPIGFGVWLLLFGPFGLHWREALSELKTGPGWKYCWLHPLTVVDNPTITPIYVPFWIQTLASAKYVKCNAETFPTMLPTVTMDPLGAPQATRAWATAWRTRKEPWETQEERGLNKSLHCVLFSALHLKHRKTETQGRLMMNRLHEYVKIM